MSVARVYRGDAKPAKLASPIVSGDTTMTVADGSVLPQTGPFIVTLDRAGATGATAGSEERVLVGAISGNTLSSLTRGYDQTTATSHIANAPCEHTSAAVDFAEANALTVRAPSGTGTLADLTSAQTFSGSKTFSGTTTVTGALEQTQVVITGTPVTAAPGDKFYTINTAADLTFTSASLARGTERTIVNLSATVSSVKATSGPIFVNSTSSSVIVLAPGETLRLYDDGTNLYDLGTTSAKSNEAWTAYTPTFTNYSGATGSFAYKIIGKTLFVRGYFTGGITSGSTAVVTVSLPAGTTTVSALQAVAVFPSTLAVPVTGCTQPSATVITLAYQGGGFVPSTNLTNFGWNAVLEIV